MDPVQSPDTPTQTPTPEAPAPEAAPTPAPETSPAPTAVSESSTPAPDQPSATNDDPGHTLGIVALVFSFLSSLIGLILGLIAYDKSKKAGKKNNLALAAIVISIAGTVIGVIVAIVIATSGVTLSTAP